MNLKQLFPLLLAAAPLFAAAQTKQPYAMSYSYDTSGNIIARTYYYKPIHADETISMLDSLDVESELGGNVRVYPNPTPGIVNVDGANPVGKVSLTYSIYTIGSQLVATTRTPATSVQFDLTGYPQGIYLLRISGKEESKTWKIIKK